MFSGAGIDYRPLICICPNFVTIKSYIYIYIYTPLDKNIRPPSKMKKNILFRNFTWWKSDIWKIRHKHN